MAQVNARNRKSVRMENKTFISRTMLKIFSLLFETRTGRLALSVYALCMLIALVVLADELPIQVVLKLMITVNLLCALMSLKRISQLRGRIADRTCDLLHIAQRAADLFFDLLILPVRIFAAPARARPRPAAARLCRLPAVTLAPRLLPIPFAGRA